MKDPSPNSARFSSRPVPQQSTRPALSVVVPAHNKPAQLSQCLRALTKYAEKDIEILVVDDCSSESVQSVAEEYDVRYFRLATRSGPAAARNFGVQQARAEVIVFIDSDVVIASDVFRIIRTEFETHPKLAALFGSYDDEPESRAFLSAFKNLLHHYTHQHANADASTFWAGCGAIRRSVFNEIGGFDEVTYPSSSIEDIELGVRLLRGGHKTLLIKTLQVKHLKKWTLKSMLYSDIVHRAFPWTRLIVRTGSVPRDLNLSWASRASAALVGLLFLLAAAGTRVSATRPSPFHHVYLAMAVASMIALLILNRGFYLFLFGKRGFGFAFLAIPVHWAYLFYSGTVFVGCGAIELLRRELNPSARERAAAKHYEPRPEFLAPSDNAGDD